MNKAYNYLKKETILENKINKLNISNINTKIITKNDIAKVIHEKTNVPIYEIINDKIESIQKLEKEFRDILSKII